MPFDHGLRLNNRQTIAKAREKPIKANKNQAVDGAEGLFLRSGSPQNVYLLPQHPNYGMDCTALKPENRPFLPLYSNTPSGIHILHCAAWDSGQVRGGSPERSW